MVDTPLNMPTQKSVGHNSHAASINDFNLQMRQQPWYQDFFTQRHLDPNKVHLSQGQRKELQDLILQRGGVPANAFNDMKIDPAGNLNTEHGFASQPTWLKALEIAAAGGAAAYFAPAIGATMAGGGGSGVTGTVAGTTAASGTTAATAAIPTLGVGAIPSVLGAGVTPTLAGSIGATAAGTTAAGTGTSLMSRIASQGGRQALSAGGRMIAQAGQTAANNRGTQIDTTLAHDELQLRADKDRRDAETDAMRKSLYGQIAAGYQPSQRPDGVPSRGPAGGYTTPQAREAGQMMTDTAMQRMRDQSYGGGITPMSQLPTKPGLMERISQYAAPAMTLFDPRLYDKDGQPHA